MQIVSDLAQGHWQVQQGRESLLGIIPVIVEIKGEKEIAG